MQLPMTVGNYGRPRVGLPTTRLVNAYIEKTEEGPTQAARIPRPGLKPSYTVGTGPIIRQYQQPGLFNGDLFTISAGQLYRVQTLLGSVAYGNTARMAAANGKLAIVSGGKLYVYDGTTLTPITTFDDGTSVLPSFSSVAVLYNIFVYTVAGSNQFFFSAVGDPATINAANLSAAQTDPSPIVEVGVLAEELLFFKSTAVEFWDFTGALAAPFALSQGRTYIRGCASQDSVVKLDNAMFWVADDLSIYRSGAVPMQISTPYINDRLQANAAQSASIKSFALSVEGHVFYVTNMSGIGESYAYDCQTQEFAQWGTQNDRETDPDLFLAATSAGHGSDTIYAGSYLDGQVYTVDPSFNGDGAFLKKVIVSAAHWIAGGVERCNNISLQCVRGVGNATAPNPLAWMRYSDDGGRTFTSWFAGQIGPVGQYRYKATWRNLGLIQQPGRLIEFAVADPVLFVAEGCTMNEARP